MGSLARIKKLVDAALTVVTSIIVAMVVAVMGIAAYTVLNPANAAGDEAVSVVDFQMRDGHHVMGSPTASLTLVEFTDFECPFCARYHNEVFPNIVKTFVEPGLLSYDVRHMPLSDIHKHAAKAAHVAECTGDRFWDFANLVFAQKGQLSDDALAEAASRVGISADRLEACLAGPQPSHIQRNLDEGKRLAVKATPTFFIGKRLGDGRVELVRQVSGARSFETFAQVINELKGDRAD